MNQILKLILPLAIIVTGRISAQVFTTDGVFSGESKIQFEANDRLYVDEQAGRKPIVCTHLRMADVSWEKRVWRTIDLREKMNQNFLYPLIPAQHRKSLLDVIKEGISNGTIYMFKDDEFKTVMTQNEALARFKREITVKKFSPTGDDLGDTIVSEEIGPDKITQYRIKEDWYFNRASSTMEVRILGIAPVYYDEDKDLYIEKGWIYFPQARPVLAAAETFHPKNDATRISYDDMFHKRMFSSFIQKESNVYNRNIAEYAKGLDALLEAEKIKGDLFKLEHDLWHF